MNGCEMFALEKSFREAGFETMIVKLPENGSLLDVDTPIGCGAGLVEEDNNFALVWATDERLFEDVKVSTVAMKLFGV